MSELIDVPWSAVWLLLVGGALVLIGGRGGAGRAGGAALIWMIGAVIISLLADDGLAPLAAVLGLLIHAAAAGETTGESSLARNAGARLIAFAGLIGVAGSDSVPVVWLSLPAVSLGLHAAVLDATPDLRNLVQSSLRFHAAAMSLVLLGSVVLCATAGTIDVAELYGPEMTSQRAAGPQVGVLLAEVSLLVGAGGFAVAGAVRRRDGRMADQCSVELPALWLLPPLAAGLLLLRLFPALAGLRAESEVVPLIGLCLMVAWGGVLVWRERRLRPLLTGLSVLLFGVWLLGIAVAAWDAAQSHGGFRTAGGLPDGSAAALACITADALALLGICGVLSSLRRGADRVEHFDGLSGLIRQRPVATIAILLCLLSLCGVPPLPGFWGRWFLWIAAWTPHHISGFTGLFDPHLGLLLGCLLVLVAQLIVAATVLRAVQSLLLDEPLGRVELRSRSVGAWTGWLLAGMLVVIGVWPGAWLRCTMEWAASRTLPDASVALSQPGEALESTTLTPQDAASR